MQRVGIDGRHRTAAAQRIEPHDDIADMQFTTWPPPFREPLHTADEDVRTKSPHIAAERGNGSVGRYEQREHVEAVEAVRFLEPCVGTRSVLDQGEGLRAIPAM